MLSDHPTVCFMQLLTVAVLYLSFSEASNQQWLPNGNLAKPNANCSSQIYPKDSTLSPVNFTTTVSDLHWSWGEDGEKYVFAITAGVGFEGGGEVYMSDDYGNAKSWRNISDLLEGLLEFEDGTFHFFRGAINLQHHRGKPGKFLVQGAARNNWVTENWGKNWTRVETPDKTIGYWTHLKMHPTQHDWMLALVRRHECVFGEESLSKWCAADLYVTQDFGKGWKNLTDNSKGRIASFVDFEWGANLRGRHRPHGENSSDDSDRTIFATAYEDPKHMKGPLPSWDKNIHYVMSQDFFTTAHEKIASCGNKFDIISGKVYLAMPSDCPYHPDGSKRKLTAEEAISSSVVLYVSNDEGTTFSEACIPVGDLDLGYRMRGTFFNEGAFLTIDHGSQDVATSRAPVSNIYSSGEQSSLFSLSLARVFRRGVHTDFTGVEGLPGMYIANVLGFTALEDAAFRWDTGLTDFEKYVQTRVSYNGGANWRLLTRPENFTYPSCDSCSKTNSSWLCQLHLHGPSSWHATEGKMPAIHSHLSAPGMVVAVGNVGEYLDFASDATCTFISSDGGETWQDIADHANVFQIGDQGGVLIMARHQTHGPADHVQFSLDEGRCWHTVKLPEAINVVDIRVEPNASSHIFLVYGEACWKGESHPTCSHTEQGIRPMGKLYALDLEEIMGEDWRICGDDQYEVWQVANEKRGCLLGRNVSISRRKQDAACFNGRGWKRPEGLDDYCDCQSEVDVECEFGFEWSWHEEKCVAMLGVDVNSCPQVKEGRYIISETHLRLLSGDKCKNISSIINDTDGMGHSTLPKPHSRLPKWAAAVIGIVGIAGIAAAAYGLTRGNSGSLMNNFVGNVGNGIAWIQYKIGRRRNGDEYFQPLTGEFAQEETSR